MGSFRRTLVGLKPSADGLAPETREFQTNPRGVEALVCLNGDRAVIEFQTNPRGVEATALTPARIALSQFQTNPRGVEATATILTPRKHIVSDEPSWG